ncbi:MULTISPECIES: amidase [unclassified Paenibacillus]|uniref:amidase n=1 Tax=unclassified Paenibacillus TaxID=185978 RepID=UPI0009A6E67D|nr:MULTISPECIES: amidase [unclassified Paenibacillus]SLK09637.1 amidase [Paenibacillus sp. RU5A]SOC71642.1 amidase [Paenibacillus sp. RU26A]SOC74028.1 amidase [Paenibacillus sp. RU5M]
MSSSSSFSYTSYDAIGLAELVRAREISPVELLEAAYARLEEVNPQLNAVIRTYETRARQEASIVRPGEQPFAGVPLLLKDISQSLEGEILTSGSRLLSEHRAQRNSNFVSRLRDAGFIIIGHTNTPEFGLKNITEPRLHGPSRNPWNINHSPGGSSGGAAAAVASGIVPLAGASDGGGSIRIPASFSGLFGLKPTRGRTPVGPGVGRQWQGASIDFALSRSVRDSAGLLDTLQVIQPEAAFHAPLFPGSYLADMNYPHQRKLKVAYTTASPVGTPVSNEAKEAVYKTVCWLEEQGHEVEEKLSPVNGVKLMENYYMMNSGEMAAMISSMERSMGRSLTSDDMEIESWVLTEAGKKVSAAEFVHSLAEWDVAAAQMSTLFERYDFYVTPVNAFPAPKIGELTPHDEQIQHLMRISDLDKIQQQQLIYEMFEPSLTYTPFTQLANLTGQPAMSVPVHLTPEGLPMGVQIMATKGREDWLLHLAGQLETSELWVGMKGNPLFPA